jgi:hypothetical protein
MTKLTDKTGQGQGPLQGRLHGTDQHDQWTGHCSLEGCTGEEPPGLWLLHCHSALNGANCWRRLTLKVRRHWTWGNCRWLLLTRRDQLQLSKVISCTDTELEQTLRDSSGTEITGDTAQHDLWPNCQGDWFRTLRWRYRAEALWPSSCWNVHCLTCGNCSKLP